MTVVEGDCQAGYFCPGGADKADFIKCPAGSYCPTGSINPTNCPRGTYSNSLTLASVALCNNCTSGFYCPQEGQTEAALTCWGGFYCPPGQYEPSPAEFICPIGVQCPNGSSIYKQCDPGYYTNSTGNSKCQICPAGFYCLPVFPHNSSLNAQPCPRGYYCPEGTELNWRSCPRGTFSNIEGLKMISECTPCTGGKFCDGVHLTSVSGDCKAGHYCESGLDRNNPIVNNNSGIATDCPSNTFYTGIGGLCPRGHYCPTASDKPIPCSAGTYADNEGQSVCKLCPEGYYCLANSTNFIENRCPAGYYCPNGTKQAFEFPCPAGTYNPNELGASETNCLECSGGLYCQGTGNPTPTGNCSAGWYCTKGSDDPKTTTKGGKCQPGFYCPVGSKTPIGCPPGEYCETEELAAPTGNCSAGYYCTGSSKKRDPVNENYGNKCPGGFYCPEKSEVPTPCAPGTYSPSEGNTIITDCQPCSFGDFCQGYNLTQTSGNCTRGYYCPQGQQVNNPFICTVGHYCPEKSANPILCPSGYYQDQTGQWTCKLCPAGYYCDNSSGVIVINDDIKCPRGYYCPPGTRHSQQWPCPLGTFGNLTGFNSSMDCTPCSPGMYCGSIGLTKPTDQCAERYYCRVYAETSTPSQGSNANICPQGSYCPKGSEQPIPCIPGTYGASTGLANVSDCTQCTGGKYCELNGLLDVEGDCHQGYYCPLGSKLRREIICPTGHFCPTGSATPTKCLVATFNPYLGLNSSDQCTKCTPGDYCETQGLNATTGPCDPGYYCPEGQQFSKAIQCPVKHYCPIRSPIYLPCQNGTYMNHTQASVCDICPAGFYCLNGELTDRCPEGYYCPEGTGNDWQACPFGTYNNDTGLKMRDECKTCPGGRYCNNIPSINPAGLCDPGYFCEFGEDRPRPTGGNTTYGINGSCLLSGIETGKGGICTLGHYCPAGTTVPLPCGAGTYSNRTGLSQCLECPAGYYCEPGKVSNV